MALERLLYATNLDEPGSRLLESLLETTKVGLREVVFLHAGGKIMAERYSQEWQPRLSGSGAKVWAHGEEGNLAASILRTAAGNSFSLVAAEFSSDGTRAVSRRDSSRLVKGLTVPILIARRVREPARPPAGGVFDHLVFATDWSPAAERAASFILGLNGLIKEMDIVNVIQEKLTVGEMRGLKQKLQDTRRAFSSQGIDAEFHIYAGRTAEEIMLAAQDYHATLIVMGNSRKAAVRKIFPGRTVYKVAEETVVPALFSP
ncbi:MAG: universal stress protein [Thermodesulfobacteriota bacterium]